MIWRQKMQWMSMCNLTAIAIYFRATLTITWIALCIDLHLYLPISPSDAKWHPSFQMLWGTFMQLLMLRSGEEQLGRGGSQGDARRPLVAQTPLLYSLNRHFLIVVILTRTAIIKGLVVRELLSDVLGAGWGLEHGDPEQEAGWARFHMAAMAGSVPGMPWHCMYLLLCCRVSSGGSDRTRDLQCQLDLSEIKNSLIKECFLHGRTFCPVKTALA